MENPILDLPPQFVKPHIAATIDSDDDFKDPPCPTNNKGKEKVESGFSADVKKLRDIVLLTQMKTPPKVNLFGHYYKSWKFCENRLFVIIKIYSEYCHVIK